MFFYYLYSLSFELGGTCGKKFTSLCTSEWCWWV